MMAQLRGWAMRAHPMMLRIVLRRAEVLKERQAKVAQQAIAQPPSRELPGTTIAGYAGYQPLEEQGSAFSLEWCER